MANIARDVLCRLRIMAHTLKLYDVQTSVKHFKEWEMCKGNEVNTYLKFAQIKFNNIFYGALFIFRILII